MKRFIELRRYVTIILLSFLALLFMAGCQESQIRHFETELSEVQSNVASVAKTVGAASYGPDETLNLIKAIQAGNAASAPFNPLALPIGAGLTGLVAVLEALRRKERGGRKYAEQKLNNGNNNNGK